LKLRDFATYDNMKIMISFYKHKNIQICTWSARNSKAVIDYFIAKRKLSELSPDLRDYLRSDIGSDHFLTLAKLRFPPKWLRLPKSAASKENILHYKIRLRNIESINGYANKEFNRNYKKFQKAAILFCNGGTTKPIISQAADESLWKHKIFTQNIKNMGC